MGLKSDIYDALVKNLGEEHINNSSDGKTKVDTLANDLSIAIRDFILAQTFRVDKLTASVGPVTTKALPVGVVGVPPGSPLPLPTIPIGLVTVEVDKDGQATGNPVQGGKPQSDFSEIRLRKNEVEEM